MKVYKYFCIPWSNKSPTHPPLVSATAHLYCSFYLICDLLFILLQDISNLFCRQYKDLIGDEEKYNLKDVIHKQNLYADIDEIDILKVIFPHGLFYFKLFLILIENIVFILIQICTSFVACITFSVDFSFRSVFLVLWWSKITNLRQQYYLL